MCEVVSLDWQDMLPRDVAEGLPKVIRREASPQRQRPEAAAEAVQEARQERLAPTAAAEASVQGAANNTEDSNVVSNVVLAIVSELFRGADTNEDGKLDAEELAQLLQQHSLPASIRINLVGEVQQSMSRMGLDAGGSVSMAQFLRLLSQPAWSFILPADLQARLPFVLLRDSFPTNPADAVYQKAYQMFDAADTDRSGYLDVDELCTLLQKFYKDGLQTNIDPEVRTEMQQKVESSVRKLGKTPDSGKQHALAATGG